MIRDTRGNEGITWTEYSTSAKRIIKRQTPASNTVAADVLIDDFLISGMDLAGVMTTHARIYTEHGLTLIDTDARGNTTIVEQDVSGRSVKVTNSMGGVTTTSYDPATGKPSLVMDALGNTVCFSYDCRGRKIAEYGTGVQPALYAYDDADNVVSLTTFRAGEEAIVSDPTERTDGDTTTWRYDASTGLLLSKTYADGTSANYEYDSMNRLERIINPRSLAAIRTYAPLTGELLSVICDDSSTTQTPAVTYSYNYLGMPVSISDGTGTREFIYNQYNELEAEKMQGLVSSVLSNTRDPLGRITGYSLLCGEETVQAVSYGYDTKGRLGNVSMDGLEAPFNYGYNVNHGLLETLSYPNTLKRWYTREEKRNLLVKVDYLRPGGQNYPAKVDYTYDILGRPMTKMDYFNTPNPDLIHNYTYNGRGELVADAMSRGGTYSYVYDNMGNRITGREGTADSSVYASNELNQYVSIIEGTQTPFLPEYDLEGNQTKVKTVTGEWSVTYNVFNQAIEFVQGETRIECLYDYLHRRVEKSVYNGENLVSRKRFIYKDYLQIAELDAVHADETVLPILKKTYLWDPVETTATRILAMRNYDETGGNPENLYFTHDRMKNAIALFGSKAGRRALYEYAPYGAVIKAEGDMALVNPFRFSSEYHDDELGMVYYNYRYLNPLDGRWINRDFINEQGGNNLYSFLYNNPIWHTDIVGLYSNEVLDYFKKNCRCLLQQAHEYGVPPEAVAMALADEYSTRPEKYWGIADAVQDTFASLGEGGGETILGGTDIGIGNINVDTAISVLTEEMKNGGFEFQSRQQMKAYLLTPQGTMHVASAYMAKVIENIYPYIPKSMNDADRYQNYVAGWREGYEKRSEKLKNNKEKIGDKYIPDHGQPPEKVKNNFNELHEIIKNCQIR